ncbi:TolB family protein [Micromonospora qiuiae]|uniref:TolB family protein n=1 Tax=Micromonospora qiuiae TaxID=502268 RepID=UPI00194FC1F1|nr:hypothetical protein [Micromonospora qiuiae]
MAVECDSGTRTELLSYSDEKEQLDPRSSVPFLGDVALSDDEATGYAEVPRGCGIAIQPLVAGKLTDFGSKITVDGKKFNISGGDHDCGAVAWVRSPVVSDDRLFFLVAPDSLGKLPVQTSDALEGFSWQLVLWDLRVDSARSVAKIPGIADLAASPDGQTVIAAIHSRGEASGVWTVDVASGQMSQVVAGKEAYHPSFSPDGRGFVYADNLSRLRFGSTPTK